MFLKRTFDQKIKLSSTQPHDIANIVFQGISRRSLAGFRCSLLHNEREKGDKGLSKQDKKSRSSDAIWYICVRKRVKKSWKACLSWSGLSHSLCWNKQLGHPAKLLCTLQNYWDKLGNSDQSSTSVISQINHFTNIMLKKRVLCVMCNPVTSNWKVFYQWMMQYLLTFYNKVQFVNTRIPKPLVEPLWLRVSLSCTEYHVLTFNN